MQMVLSRAVFHRKLSIQPGTHGKSDEVPKQPAMFHDTEGQYQYQSPIKYIIEVRFISRVHIKNSLQISSTIFVTLITYS